jgi:cation:H+ antiporter
MIWYLILFIASALLLAKSGTMTVKSLTKIAEYLKWKKFIVASLIMGFVSSAPELFVGITAAINNKPQLSFGNIIGSNMLLLTLVIGISVLWGGKVLLKGVFMKRSYFYIAFYALLPLILMADGAINRVDGIILIISLVFYLKELREIQSRYKEELNTDEPIGKASFKQIGILLLAIVLMVLSAQGIVFAATRLALQLNLSLVLIGLLVVAVGTSLPEIAFGLRSAMMNQKEMLLGNVFGSIVVNSALVLGITALIAPFKIFNPGFYVTSLIFTILSVLLFIIFSKTHEAVTKKEAKVLVGVYVLYFIFQLIIN